MKATEEGTTIAQVLRQAEALIGARPPRPATRMEAPDLVLLVPGFLGFSRFGGFYYFAERVVAALRASLEEAVGYPLPVVPCTTLPTDRLAKRQVRLVDTLTTLCDEHLSGVERIHLVGHSTGGVDVQLLACTTDISGNPWGKAAQAIRQKLKSVVTISAPHYGTWLAESRLARWGANPLWHPFAIFSEARTLVDLLMLVPRDLAVAAGMPFAAPNDVMKFMWQIALHHELIDDLRPRNMEALRVQLTQDPAIALTCFVTGTVPRDDAGRASDPFFKDMYDMTSGSGGDSKMVMDCQHLLREVMTTNTGLVIRSSQSHMPPLDARLNDGVVNTARQIVHPGTPDEIGGLAVADHGDVLGHYDFQDALIDGKPYGTGLFHSGAAFGDNEFFKLYGRVGQAILKRIPRAGLKGQEVA